MLAGIDRLKVSVLVVAGLVALAFACSNQPDEVAPVPTQPQSSVAQPTVKPNDPPTPVIAPLEIPAQPPTQPIVFSMGISEEPTTVNFWNYYAGSASTVWTGYVLDGVSTSLYDQSHQRFDWIPIVADGFPSPLIKESIGGTEFWTSEVNLKKGIKWSDGVEITAQDFVFVVDTILELELGGNSFVNVDPDFLDRVEALDPYTVKVFFKAMDADGNPQKPGLSIWQFGLAFTPILAKHYWEPIVQAAKQAGDTKAQHAALFSHVPDGEPTAGGFVFERWEPGAFVRNQKDPNWFRSGIQILEYQNGAYRERIPGNGYDVTFYGDPVGPTTLDMMVGPNFDTALFNVYSRQDAAILALINGEIDYLFSPQGLEKGFQDQIKAAPDLELVSNAANSVRYLGFNFRKAPMDNLMFRKAIATMIDKEFVANTILQGSAAPAYSMIADGNSFWYNPDVSKIGQGLEFEQRVTEAVRMLKEAGFTYEVEPRMDEDGVYVEQQGEGLRMPDGTPVPELEILAPSDGYDPLRATFAIRIERWLNDIGIPVKAKLTGFDVIAGTMFEDPESLDLWILGWSLTPFPDYLDLYFNTQSIDEGFNFGAYSNPAFDTLANKLLSDTDVIQARDTVYKLQEIVAEDLPYVVLFSPTTVDAYRPSSVKFPYTQTLGGIQSSNGLQKVVLID